MGTMMHVNTGLGLHFTRSVFPPRLDSIAPTPSFVLGPSLPPRCALYGVPSTADDSRERPQAVLASREAEADPARIHNMTALNTLRLSCAAQRRLTVHHLPPRHARDCARTGLAAGGIIA